MVSGSGAAVATTGTAAVAVPKRRSAESRDLFLIAENIDQVGGVQRVAHALAALFAGRGHRVRLIGVRPFEPRHAYPSAGVAYATHVLGPPTANREWDGLEGPSAQDLERLDALFAEAPSGIVICMQVHAMKWVAAAKAQHLRVIGQSHESFLASVGFTDRKRSRYHRITELYRDVDTFLLLTHADAVQFRRTGMNNTAVMANPVAFEPTRRAPLTSPTVVTVGRLAPEKNHEALIDAFARLAPDHREWRLKIFGDGSLCERLERYSGERGVPDQVQLMGATDQVERVLQDSSVFGLSSDAEGLPIALIEAMSCGVPCVSYECTSGIRDIITDGVDGIIVPHGSVSELSDGLRRLIEAPEERRRMGAAAFESAKRFSAEQIVDRWEALFESVER